MCVCAYTCVGVPGCKQTLPEFLSNCMYSDIHKSVAENIVRVHVWVIRDIKVSRVISICVCMYSDKHKLVAE